MKESIEITQPEKREVFLASIMDLMEKEYFSLLDDIESLEDEQIAKLEEIIEVDIADIGEFIDEKMPRLLEKVNEISKHNSIIIVENSVSDIMRNSIIGGISAVKKIIENIKDEKVKKKEDLSVNYVKLLTIFQNIFRYGTYYLDDICRDESKLKMELARINGYLEEFGQYFNKIKVEENKEVRIKRNFPTGSKKVFYFVFFSKLEKGELSWHEAEKEMDRLDEIYLNKEQLRFDIENNKFRRNTQYLT